MIIAMIKQDKSVLNGTIAFITFSFLSVINYIRYLYRENNNYKVMQEKWDNEKNFDRKGLIVTAYILCSVLAFVVLAIFSGTKKY